GFYEGKMVFIEPMVALDYLLTQPTELQRLSLPARYPKPGAYPREYGLIFDDVAREYLIYLTDCVVRDRAWRVTAPTDRQGDGGPPAAGSPCTVRQLHVRQLLMPLPSTTCRIAACATACLLLAGGGRHAFCQAAASTASPSRQIRYAGPIIDVHLHTDPPASA